MRRTLLALTAAAVALAAAPAVASAQDDQIRVFFPGDCVTNAYKPKKITLACADAGAVLNKVKYISYGEQVARGTGVARVNDCEPDCASGTFHKYDVRFRLYRVKQCGDVPQFTRLRYRYVGPKPPGSDRALSLRYPCANAPGR